MCPVLDHEVHEKVKINENTPYGCNGRSGFSKGYWVQEREYRRDGTYVMRDHFIPHRLSADCRSFYLWNIDPRCSGCTTKKDKEYARIMSGLGS